MRFNIETNFINCNIYRLLVDFVDKNEASIKDQLIGRASHVMYLSSKDFINYILLAFSELFVWVVEGKEIFTHHRETELKL